jgi:phosphoglycerate dehydrogenase-like enzyme
MKVAILDDYQGVAQELADWSKLNQTCDIKVFREPFDDEAHAIENLKEFEALLIMRERTPITAKLIDGCPNLKFIATSGMRNLAIDLDYTKKKELLFLERMEIKILQQNLLGQFY